MPTTLHSGGAQPQKLSNYKKGATNKGIKKAVVKNGSSGKVRKPKKMPEWDSSTNDLNAHKLSRQELELRHKSYRSKNLEVAKHELYDKAKNHFDLDSSGNLRPSSLSTGPRKPKSQKLLAIQQSLHSMELHDVLAHSDHSMRIVKDLFGDDPKRYTCQPNVTVAPNVREKQQLQAITQQQQQQTHGGSGYATALESPGGIWDDSMQELMVQRKPALNDSNHLVFGDSEGENSTLTPDPVHTNGGNRVEDLSSIASIDSSGGTTHELAYKSVLDIQRFQKLLEQEDHSSPPSDKKTERHKKSNGRVERGPDMAAVRQVYIDIRESGQVEKPRIEGWSLGALKGARSDGRVCDSSAQRVSGDFDGVAAVSEASSIPMESEVQGQGGNIAEGISIPPPLPPERTYQQGSNTAILTDHPLLISHKMQVQHGSSYASGYENGFGGDSADSTLHSKRTGKIHADLTSLEKLVHGLDQELAAYKRSTFSRKQISAKASSSPPAEGGEVLDRDSLLRDVKQQLEHSESQLMGEVAVRGQFLQTLTDQQDLIDTLTADLLNLQRENVIVKKELANVRCQSTEQVAKLKEEIGNIRSAVFSIVQQSQPYNAIHSTPQSYDDCSAYSQVSHEVSHDIFSQMPHCQVSDASHLPGVPSQSEAVTVLRPDLSIDTNFSLLAQPWVELKPKTDNELPALANNRVSPISRAGNLKGNLPRYVPGGSCRGVVYAQVSPFSYSDDSDKQVPLVSESLPISLSAHELSAKYKPISPASHCDPPPTYQTSPVPPMISVALQIPPAASQPQLSNPQVSINPESKVQKTSRPQAWVEETKANNTDARIDASIRTSAASTVPKETARSDVPLETLASKSHPLTTEGLESVKTTHLSSIAGTMLQNDMASFPPEAASRYAKSSVPQTTHDKTSHMHAQDGHHPMQEFDVTALLESLRQLDKTQGQLKATADRLDQKFALSSSSSAPSLMKSNIKHGQSNAPSSSPSLGCFTYSLSTPHSEVGELEMQQGELLSVLTPIPEESTLTSSQMNLEECGGEREGKYVSSVMRSSKVESFSFDQVKNVDQHCTPTALCGSKSSIITTECRIKSLPLISVKDNGLEAASDQSSYHHLQCQGHSSKEDISVSVGSLRQINPEPSSTASGEGGGANPGTWFSLRSHLSQ